jgi:N utilization substance protein A
MATLPRTEFAQALKAIASERGLDADVILDTIKQAIIAAYRRDAKELGEDVDSFEYDVEIDPSSGEARVFGWPEGEEDKREDITPPGFGRIAAQTAKQVIHQKIREAEKGAIMDEFSDRIGTLISGMVLRFDGPDVRVDLGRTEGLMPASERVPNERLSANQRYTFLLKDIEETARGKQLILSRTDPDFVVKLFEREVPEMSSGSVEVRAVSREAGVRTKIAVDSSQSGVDPVGSCVGQKGVRVQAVTNELGGERVDIIPWSDSTEELIKASLSPAEGLTVTLKEEENEEGEIEKTAIVQAPEDQLSLAIGKDGQNARLAAKLTGYKIEIEGIEGEEVKKENKEEEPEEKKEEVVEEKKKEKEEKDDSEEKEEESGEKEEGTKEEESEDESSKEEEA